MPLNFTAVRSFRRRYRRNRKQPQECKVSTHIIFFSSQVSVTDILLLLGRRCVCWDCYLLHSSLLRCQHLITKLCLKRKQQYHNWYAAVRQGVVTVYPLTSPISKTPISYDSKNYHKYDSSKSNGS